MSDQPIPKEPTLVELGSSSDRDQSRRIESTLRSLQRWWRRQTTPRIEDEVIDRSGGRSVNGLIWPVFAPLLAVPAAVCSQYSSATSDGLIVGDEAAHQDAMHQA